MSDNVRGTTLSPQSQANAAGSGQDLDRDVGAEDVVRRSVGRVVSAEQHGEHALRVRVLEGRPDDLRAIELSAAPPSVVASGTGALLSPSRDVRSAQPSGVSPSAKATTPARGTRIDNEFTTA
jgi:hypothetical protein